VKVLVAGGTGRLGSLVVTQLTERNVAVRVLTRDPDRATPLRPLGIEIVEGDVRRPASLPAAMVDVDLVLSAVQGFAGPGHVSPESVDREGNGHLFAAAAAAGAAVVMVSIVGAAPDSPMELFRCKYSAEQSLRARGVPWTIVRATAFVELWAELVGKGVVFGRGDNPINFVSVRDVADVVTDTVLEPARRGQVVEIGGPEDMTFNELAAALRDVRGRPTKVRHVPRAMLRAMAPLNRQPRAALVMDTDDMTYRPTTGRIVGGTNVRAALTAGSAGTC
jgi:uncharacterized protein YbjT (DUF2867 family)